MEKQKIYNLDGFIVATDWYNQRGWKRLHIRTNEKGLEEIEREPLQDFIEFGVQTINYAQFDVYETIIKRTKNKITTIENTKPIKMIKDGSNILSKREMELLSEDIRANITY